MNGYVRVTAGKWRSRKVVCPPAHVRPTTSWAREMLFAWLRSCVNATVLDATAGSGILGLEALSRGAAHAHFWDIEPAVLTQLQQNVDHLQAQAVCEKIDVTEVQRNYFSPESIDMLLYDPPYQAPWALEALERLLSFGWVKPAGWVFFESHQPGPERLGLWVLYRQKQRGQVCLNLYHQHNNNGL